MKTLALLCALLATSVALPLRESSTDMIEDRASGNVKFYLYTKANPTEPQELIIDDLDSVKSSNFDKSRQTKVIVHGWGGSYTTAPNRQVREAYLSQEDVNSISVDWYPYAKLNYLSARAKVPVVGEDIAELLDFLNEKFGLNFDATVLIGHSLGAHVVGYCGKRVSRGKIAGIVGLDPAMPLYDYTNSETRLDSTDAKYVQSIQTNGGVKGFLQPIGGAAFYPNWGRSQPGCGIDVGGNCAHGRCVTLYAEAIRGYSFAPIYKCTSFDNISEKNECGDLDFSAQMGDPLQVRRVEGIFYFNTEDKAPFGYLSERRQKTLFIENEN